MPDAPLLKLHLGCGPKYIPGWINVDMDAKYHIDLQADVRDLPLVDNCAEELYASHLLEHFGHEEPVLEEWYRVLAPGGRISVIVPDLVGVYYAWQSGMFWGSPKPQPMDLAYFNATAYGAHILGIGELSEAGHTHKQVFIFDMLVERMRELFPDAHRASALGLGFSDDRQVSISETLVQGTKPK